MKLRNTNIKIALPTLMLSLALGQANSQITTISSIGLGQEDPVFGNARYSGMGGAMGAIGGNFSSLRDNPASIGTAVKSDISFTPNVFADNKGKCSFNVNDVSALFTIEHRPSGYVSTALAIGYGRTRNYARTTSKFRDNAYQYDVPSTDPNELPQTVVYNSEISDIGTESNGSGTVHVAYAGNVNNTVYFGVDLGLATLKYKYRDKYNIASNEVDGVADGNWFAPDDYYRVTDGWGVNLRAGVVYQPCSVFRIGASIETPTLYKIDEWWEMHKWQAVEQEDNTIVDEIADYSAEYSYDLRVPFKFGVSMGFMIKDRVNIGIDYSMRNYAKTCVEIEDLCLLEVEKEIDLAGKNQHTIKFGIEANVVKGLDLRAGYSYVSSPMQNFDSYWESCKSVGGMYIDSAEPSYSFYIPGNRHYITAGLGYTGKICYVDFAYVRRLSNEYYVETVPTGGDMTLDNIAKNPTMHGSEKLKSNSFMLTFGVRF